VRLALQHAKRSEPADEEGRALREPPGRHGVEHAMQAQEQQEKGAGRAAELCGCGCHSPAAIRLVLTPSSLRYRGNAATVSAALSVHHGPDGFQGRGESHDEGGDCRRKPNLCATVS